MLSVHSGLGSLKMAGDRRQETMMSDKMYIRDLGLECTIGTNPEERTIRQKVLINICIECDLSQAGESDELQDTINYKSLTEDISAMVTASEFFLIEKLASEICRICLNCGGVAAATVCVDKPGALDMARSVAVEVRREMERGMGNRED